MLLEHGGKVNVCHHIAVAENHQIRGALPYEILNSGNGLHTAIVNSAAAAERRQNA